MLTNIEKIIFILLALTAVGISYITFNKMFKAIGVGSQQIDWKRALLNFPKGLEVFIAGNASVIDDLVNQFSIIPAFKFNSWDNNRISKWPKWRRAIEVLIHNWRIYSETKKVLENRKIEFYILVAPMSLQLKNHEVVNKLKFSLNCSTKDGHKIINQIANETASDLLKQLIGSEVNKSNVSAIIEDLLKKEKHDGI